MLLRATAARAAGGEVVAAVFPGSWEDAFQNIVAPALMDASDDRTHSFAGAGVRPVGQDDGIAGAAAIRRASDVARPDGGRHRERPDRAGGSRQDRSLGRSFRPLLPERMGSRDHGPTRRARLQPGQGSCPEGLRGPLQRRLQGQGRADRLQEQQRRHGLDPDGEGLRRQRAEPRSPVADAEGLPAERRCDRQRHEPSAVAVPAGRDRRDDRQHGQRRAAEGPGRADRVRGSRRKARRRRRSAST